MSIRDLSPVGLELTIDLIAGGMDLKAAEAEYALGRRSRRAFRAWDEQVSPTAGSYVQGAFGSCHGDDMFGIFCCGRPVFLVIRRVLNAHAHGHRRYV